MHFIFVTNTHISDKKLSHVPNKYVMILSWNIINGGSIWPLNIFYYYFYVYTCSNRKCQIWSLLDFREVFVFLYTIYLELLQDSLLEADKETYTTKMSEDILSKKEREALLNKRMEQIRAKNAALEKVLIMIMI